MPTRMSGSEPLGPYDAFPVYADVIVPRGPNRPFTYLIPVELRSILSLGRQVLVPFRSASVPAVVVGLHRALPAGIRIQHIKSILSVAGAESNGTLSTGQLQLSGWLSERFLAPWGQCVKLVSVPGRVPTRSQLKWMITPAGQQLLSSPGKLSVDQRNMLERLARRSSGLAWRTLKRSGGLSAVRVRTSLVRRGLMKEVQYVGLPAREDPIGRPPAASRFFSGTIHGHESWTRQAGLVFPDRILSLWESEQAGAVLFQAGGKDRLNALIQVAEHTLQRKRRVLIVAGQIRRAQELAEALIQVGIKDVCLFHGELSARQKRLAWHEMESDDIRVLVGTRSAVCAPMRDLGLVWVEGEEDAALKEEQTPRYHAREVARMRAESDRAVLVLASAHPSLESMHAAMTGKAVLHSAPGRRQPVTVQIIDLRRFPAGTLVTPPVIDGIRTALAERRLVIAVLNRKGYASLLLCQACGETPSCPACSLALRFHKRSGRLICHSCGHMHEVPDTCPTCHAAKLQPIGAGTERAEELLLHHFPHIRVARMDSEVIRRRSQAEALLALSRAGEIDVLIGTRMLFAHIGTVRAGLVAVLNADAGLHMPDFRSAEQTYHDLQDALSLVEENGHGTMLVQTHLPHHHAVEAVARDRPSLFIDTELSFRQALHYPPFTHLVRLDVSGTSERQVRHAAERWAAALQRVIESGTRCADPSSSSGMGLSCRRPVSVMGPAPAPVPRLRRRYHWRLLVRSPSQEEVLNVVGATLVDMERHPRSGDLKWSIDVDPCAML
jgi:primosomal protein N' (replication factor Y)